MSPRKTEVAVKKTGRPAPKPTKAQKLVQLAGEYERSQEVAVERLKEVAKAVQVIWTNQLRLTESANRLDEQFCVLGRLAISTLNTILVRIGADNELIDEKKLETFFKEWAAFRGRSDYQNYMLEWMLGVPLNTLPAEPAKEEQKPATTGPEASTLQAVEVGGDYNETKSEERDQTTVPAATEGNKVTSDAVSSG
jgi:hypothetical protein